MERAHVGNPQARVHRNRNEVRYVLPRPSGAVLGIGALRFAFFGRFGELDLAFPVFCIASVVHAAEFFIGKRQFLFAARVVMLSALVLHHAGRITRRPFIRVAEFKEGFDDAHVFGGGAGQHAP